MIEILVFVFGVILGSFANVCIYRSHVEESLFLPSHCPQCARQIAWYDLIPVFSYLALLSGQCRYCKYQISWQYPLVELFCGIGFYIFFLIDQLTPALAYHCILFLLLAIIAVGDFLYQEINDWHILTTLFWVFGWQLYFGNAVSALAGGGLGLLLALGIYAFGSWRYGRPVFGLGDIGLSAVVGEIVGWHYVVPVYVAALLIHVVIAGIQTGLQLLRRRSGEGFNEMVPFGPPLVFATALSPIIRDIILL